MYQHMNDINPIADILSSRGSASVAEQHKQRDPASVLVPLFKQGDILKVLFTKRSNQMEHHKGQISFPGGAVDAQDQTLADTALREAHEEIGLASDDVNILGPLDYTVIEVNNFIVYPFVGVIPYPYNFIISRDEVSEILTVPFELFLDHNPIENEQTEEVRFFSSFGPVYQHDDNIIWGATARIMQSLVDLLKGEALLPVDNRYLSL